ncbi:hypothetical protein B0J14DRAFT_698504 [Halenospora varia]|nr:hypothetical protein B0J14DRAFT_698504 [Halenospora varia]
MGLSRFLLRMIIGPAIPPHITDNDGWIATNSTIFTAQWIDCHYPVSGAYERMPRYLYYGLVLLALFYRNRAFVVDIALGSVMTFSGVSSIHAVMLAATRFRMVPQSLLDNYASITISGNGGRDIQLANLPMVWDADSDAVLAVVGVAFLVVTPMQIWSGTFRESNRKPVLWLWTVLLLAGMVAALINEQVVQYWTFRQLRFCPIGNNDTLPLRSGGRNYNAEPWGPDYAVHINDTITKEFVEKARTIPSICVYSCFDTSSPFRNSDDIIATDLVGWINLTTDAYWKFIYAIYIIVPISVLSTLTLFLIKPATPTWNLLRQNLRNVIAMWLTAISFYSKLKFTGIFIWDTYSQFMSVVVLIGFTVWIEYTMKWDHQGKNFALVDQWAPLVGAALVCIAILINYAQTHLEASDEERSRSRRGATSPVVADKVTDGSRHELIGTPSDLREVVPLAEEVELRDCAHIAGGIHGEDVPPREGVE